MKQKKDRNRELIEERFATIWPVNVAAFTRFMVELRRHFDGDLDMMLVMAVIGDRTPPDNWARELVDYGALTQRTGRVRPPFPLNLQSISEFSGIPRETVRRKLALLAERGWIVRDGKGHVSAAPQASSDLREATVASMNYLASIATAFEIAREERDSDAWRPRARVSVGLHVPRGTQAPLSVRDPGETRTLGGGEPLVQDKAQIRADIGAVEVV